LAVTAQEFRVRFPEFDGQKNSDIDAMIAQALRMVSSTPDGDLRDDAVGFGAAHLFTIAPFGEEARIDPATAKEGLATTIYGRRFLAYLRMLTPTIMAV